MSVYGTKTWRKLREGHIMEHPLCEVCEARGRVEPAIDVHHRESFMLHEGEDRMKWAFDPSNLMSVCHRCHRWLHRHGKASWLSLETIVEQMEEEEHDKRRH